MRILFDGLRPAMSRAVAVLAGLGLAFGASAVGASTDAALAASPWWQISSSVRPGNLPPGGSGLVSVKAVNLGDTATTGPSVVKDVLPPGLQIEEKEVEEGVFVPKVEFVAFGVGVGGTELGPGGFLSFLGLCTVSGNTVECRASLLPALEAIQPFEDLEIRIHVKVEGATTGAVNQAEVSGGGAGPATTSKNLTVDSAPTPFGVEELSFAPEEEGGAPDTQAGSHPFQVTSVFSLNQNASAAQPPALPRNVQFRLPAGLVGNTTAVPQCSDLDFRHVVLEGSDLCPANTVVGAASVTIDEPVNLELRTVAVPVFNLVPEEGEPARFGFEVSGTAVTLDTAVRAGSDYGVNVSVNNITQLTNFLSSTVTIWGAPGDARHDNARGWSCLVSGHWREGTPCQPQGTSEPVPFLRLPTSCGQPFTSGVSGVSWPFKGHPEGVALSPVSSSLHDRFGRELSLSGCDRLPFKPELDIQPDSSDASTPTGMTVRLKLPQEANRNAVGLATSDVKDVLVTLPEGLRLNAGGADGLQACLEGLVGFESLAEDGTALFTPTLPVPTCPSASKIGTAHLKVPILGHPIDGSVFLAAQTENPFGSLIAMYVVAQDPVSGVLLKLAGEVKLSETGQISTLFRNAPQAPLEEAEFRFFGGPRAALATPAKCGSYQSTAAITPWSSGEPVSASSTFAITAGALGTACKEPLPFKPELEVGSSKVQAGAFTALTTTIAREDGDQELQSVKVTLPPGVAGMISNVTPCGETQADNGTCGPESLIGHSTVTAGIGSNPYTIEGGLVFLTGPYKGAPFGLSIVTHAKAGPFDLGNVIVRAKLEVDPQTVRVTVLTDPNGPYAIPRYVDKVPVSLQRVSVVIDRENFGFNPTNCAHLESTGVLQSFEGAVADLTSSFGVVNCATLGFAPKLSVTVDGRATKVNGTSLTAKLAYPNAPRGTQTNIGRVKVTLPVQVASRLETLNLACLAQTFETERSKCPPQSLVGHAIVHTPVLPVPLSGPAYLVSHGGEEFPSLTLVLSGDNVTIELVGATLIRNGVTSTTFKSPPDVPFSTFELVLPKGRYSVLGATANLCKSKLVMPTEFRAQNGKELKQNVKIHVAHCSPSHKKHGRKSRASKHAHGRRGRH